MTSNNFHGSRKRAHLDRYERDLSVGPPVGSVPSISETKLSGIFRMPRRTGGLVPWGILRARDKLLRDI